MYDLSSTRKRNYPDTVPAELVWEVWAGEQRKEQMSPVPLNPDHTPLSAVLMNGYALPRSSCSSKALDRPFLSQWDLQYFQVCDVLR